MLPCLTIAITAPAQTTPTRDDGADGVYDTVDNCPRHTNRDQLNTDGDADDDNDGVPDDLDSCPLIVNQRRIAFTSARSGNNNYEIYKMNADGTGVTGPQPHQSTGRLRHRNQHCASVRESSPICPRRDANIRCLPVSP